MTLGGAKRYSVSSPVLSWERSKVSSPQRSNYSTTGRFQPNIRSNSRRGLAGHWQILTKFPSIVHKRFDQALALIVLDIIARGANLAVEGMKRIILRYASPLLGLIIALLGFGVRISHAQQTMEVPQPMPQGQPSIHYRPKPTPSIVTPPPQVPDQSNQSDVIPSMPTPPAAEPTPEAETQPPSYRMVQPVLPAIFRGCWEGKVEFLDSIERLPGAAKVGIWTPKTYRLCYQRYGDGPFQLTFSEAGIDSNSKIINPLNSLDL